MTEESTEIPKYKNLFIKDRIEYLLGMVVCIYLIFVFLEKNYNLNHADLHISFMYCFLSSALGFFAFLFGYKLFSPVTPTGWIKNKVKIFFTLSVLLAIVLMISLNHRYKTSKPMGFEGKNRLFDVYLACKGYWHEKSPNDKCSLEIAEKYDYIPQPDEWTINIHDGQEESFYATAYKPIIETIGFIPHKDATNYKYVKKVKGGILATVNSKGELQANKITHDCDWLERFESNLYGSNYTCF